MRKIEIDIVEDGYIMRDTNHGEATRIKVKEYLKEMQVLEWVAGILYGRKVRLKDADERGE